MHQWPVTLLYDVLGPRTLKYISDSINLLSGALHILKLVK
jgi:hypothetical protein